MRQIIGRKPIFENNAESMGLITLEYPAIKNIKRPSSLIDYLENYGGNVTDNDWHDFLKLSLDYVFRVGNHIQPLIDGERKYVRDSNIGTPITAPNDIRKGISHWPIIAEEDGIISSKQNRLIMLLCVFYLSLVFFFKQKTAYEIGVRLVGSEMCISDRLKDKYPDVKLLYGIEAYECEDREVKDKNSKYWHLIIIAKNEAGRQAVKRLSTLCRVYTSDAADAQV